MNKAGARIIIESLSLRIFEIEEMEARLAKEKADHRARIAELEKVEDPILPDKIISVK